VTELSQPPVRLCCGQRHEGAVCPDGLVMCCLCFSRFAAEDLHVTADGGREDVCNGCAALEAAHG
jgi:hypothetical protein